MPDQEQFDNLYERELESMRIILNAKVNRTVLTLQEYVMTRQAQGGTLEAIERELIDDLKGNGRIFGEFKRNIRATAVGSLNKVRDAGYYSDFGVTEQYRWSAVLVNTCPDCLERHGQVKSWDEWEEEGLPRAGSTVCRDNCHCVLIPVEYTELEPIFRKKKK